MNDMGMSAHMYMGMSAHIETYMYLCRFVYTCLHFCISVWWCLKMCIMSLQKHLCVLCVYLFFFIFEIINQQTDCLDGIYMSLCSLSRYVWSVYLCVYIAVSTHRTVGICMYMCIVYP